MDEKEEKKCLVAEGYKSEQEVRGSPVLVSTWWKRFCKKDKKERKVTWKAPYNFEYIDTKYLIASLNVSEGLTKRQINFLM